MCFDITRETRKYANATAVALKKFDLYLWLEDDNIVRYMLKSLYMNHTYLSGRATDADVRAFQLYINTEVVKLKANKEREVHKGYHFLTHPDHGYIRKIEDITNDLLSYKSTSFEITLLIIASKQIYIDITRGVGVCGSFSSDLTIINPLFTYDGEQTHNSLDGLLTQIQGGITLKAI